MAVIQARLKPPLPGLLISGNAVTAKVLEAVLVPEALQQPEPQAIGWQFPHLRS